MTPEQLASSGTEHGHQMALMQWAALSGNPLLDNLFAIPMGGLRDKVTAANIKAEGARRGVPDLMLAVTRRAYAGLFIEMKKPALKPKRASSRGGVSAYQSTWRQRLLEQHYSVIICYSWIEARDAILEYLAGRQAGA